MKNKIGIERDGGRIRLGFEGIWVKMNIGIGRNMGVEEEWDWKEYGCRRRMGLEGIWV